MSKQPTNPHIFEWRPRTVGPKQEAKGAWETALMAMAPATPMPPVYEPLPTTSRLRQKRRAQVQALNGHHEASTAPPRDRTGNQASGDV